MLDVFDFPFFFSPPDIILPDVSKETVMEASPNQDPFLRIAKKSDRFYNLEDARQPYICDNSSMVAPDPKKVYGYFQRTFTVQRTLNRNSGGLGWEWVVLTCVVPLPLSTDPIARFNVSGQQWVRQGQPVDLVFQCSGTPPFEFCYNLNHGKYGSDKLKPNYSYVRNDFDTIPFASAQASTI